jgi:heat-inducible transcriptional repressor
MLNERSKQVLCAVIQCYINSPGPVGSRAVTKKFSFGLSSATIRNIMSDLEEMGFLHQPHTSAGRVPTDIGYRFFVDTIKEEKTNNGKDLLLELNKKMELLKKDINYFLDEASRMLSFMSHYIGITMSPDTELTTLTKVELLKYRKNQAAVILITDEGLIRNKMVSIDDDITQKDLNRMSEYINSEFAGHTLSDIRKRIILELAKEKFVCDKLIAEAVRIFTDIFSSASSNIYVSGLSEVLALPDFCDVERIRELLKTIEDKQTILKLLDKIADSEGTQVFIGSENPVDEMKKYSLIVSRYSEGNRPIGAIGIIGPRRMNYQKTISIVDMTASYITAALSAR